MLLPVFVLHALNWLVASGSGKHRHEVPDGCHQAMSEQLLVAESDNHDSWLTFTTYCLCVQSHAQCEFQAGLVPMWAAVFLRAPEMLWPFFTNFSPFWRRSRNCPKPKSSNLEVSSSQGAYWSQSGKIFPSIVKSTCTCFQDGLLSNTWDVWKVTVGVSNGFMPGAP